jgi:hypothetical protein
MQFLQKYSVAVTLDIEVKVESLKSNYKKYVNENENIVLKKVSNE